MLYAFSKSGLSSKKPTSGEIDSMSDEVKKYNEVFEVRLTPGNSGDDPEAPNWEVWEIKADGEEIACDNRKTSRRPAPGRACNPVCWPGHAA